MRIPLLLALAIPSLAFGQGTLTPTAAPATTMRSLDQIDARTPLGTPGQVTTTTVTIDQPGSYVLVGDITVSSGNGIAILSRNVTLDLNGFTITSTAATPEGTGILLGNVDHYIRNIRITNGRIVSGAVYSFTNAHGVSFAGPGFIYGIAPGAFGASIALGVRIDNVSVSGVPSIGIYADGQSRVTRCQVRTCGNGGITATVVQDCQAFECIGGIDGELVFDSTSQVVLGSPAINATSLAVGSRGIHIPEVANEMGYGLVAGGVAVECVGIEVGSTGLAAPVASRCYGVGTQFGLTASVAEACIGESPAVALSGTIAIGSVATGGGTVSTTSTYLMP